MITRSTKMDIFTPKILLKKYHIILERLLDDSAKLSNYLKANKKMGLKKVKTQLKTEKIK